MRACEHGSSRHGGRAKSDGQQERDREGARQGARQGESKVRKGGREGGRKREAGRGGRKGAAHRSSACVCISLMPTWRGAVARGASTLPSPLSVAIPSPFSPLPVSLALPSPSPPALSSPPSPALPSSPSVCRDRLGSAAPRASCPWPTRAPGGVTTLPSLAMPLVAGSTSPAGASIAGASPSCPRSAAEASACTCNSSVLSDVDVCELCRARSVAESVAAACCSSPSRSSSSDSALPPRRPNLRATIARVQWPLLRKASSSKAWLGARTTRIASPCWKARGTGRSGVMPSADMPVTIFLPPPTLQPTATSRPATTARSPAPRRCCTVREAGLDMVRKAPRPAQRTHHAAVCVPPRDVLGTSPGNNVQQELCRPRNTPQPCAVLLGTASPAMVRTMQTHATSAVTSPSSAAARLLPRGMLAGDPNSVKSTRIEFFSLLQEFRHLIRAMPPINMAARGAVR